MIVIIGASGAIGIPTIKNLIGRGVEIRALTSNETSATRLRGLGVAECVIGDFRSDEDVAGVLKGGEQVMQIPPRFTQDEFDIAKRCIDAAKREGIAHYLFLSAFHTQVRSVPHHLAKLLAEEYLIESGLLFTILQPSMFMQNIRVEWPKILKEGIYARPYSPHKKMSVVDTRNVGEVAAKILTDPALQGATYELCGPEALTHTEMAQILSEELGRKVKAAHRDLDDWRAFAVANNWTDFAMETYVAMCKHYDAIGYGRGTDVVLKALLGRKPTSYRAFVKDLISDQSA